MCVFDNQNKYTHFAQGTILFFLKINAHEKKKKEKKNTGAVQNEEENKKTCARCMKTRYWERNKKEETTN